MFVWEMAKIILQPIKIAKANSGKRFLPLSKFGYGSLFLLYDTGTWRSPSELEPHCAGCYIYEAKLAPILWSPQH